MTIDELKTSLINEIYEIQARLRRLENHVGFTSPKRKDANVFNYPNIGRCVKKDGILG